MHISKLTGPDLEAALPQLAALRIKVFRDYPYLYDGSLDYEQSYLQALTHSKDSVIVAAEDGGKIAGCATGSALEGHHEGVRGAVSRAWLQPKRDILLR